MKFVIYLLERFELMKKLIEETMIVILKNQFQKLNQKLVRATFFLTHNYFPKPRGTTQ